MTIWVRCTNAKDVKRASILCIWYHGQHKGLKSKCEVCDGVYKNSYVLKVHFNQSHRERKFKCEKYNKMFPFKSSLEKHIEKLKGFE